MLTAQTATVASQPLGSARPDVAESDLVMPEFLRAPQTVVSGPLARPAEPERETPEPALASAAPRTSRLGRHEPTPTEAFATVMGATPRRRWRRWPIVLLLIALVGIADVAAAVVLRDRVPAGVTVNGVSLGNDAASARAALQRLNASASATPVTLVAGDASTSINPADASLAINVDATLASVTGLTFAPADLWTRAFGTGGPVPPVVSTDAATLARAMAGVARTLDSQAKDAVVTLVGAEAIVAPARQSVVVDPQAGARELVAAWPTAQPIAISAKVTDAGVTTAEARTLATTLNGAFAGPTTLVSPNGDVTLTAAQVAAVSSVVAVDGRLQWHVDGPTLANQIVAANPGVNNAPVDATFTFDTNHQLKVVHGVPGRVVDSAALGEVVVAAAASPAHTADMPYLLTDPAVTASDLPTQDFTTRVSSFRTPLTNEPIRTKNLIRGAQLVTGTVVKPNEDFNLGKILEPYTAANGYYEAHVIVDGFLAYGYGGGLSQMATTTYNAGYFAGMKDVTHRPHSVWFPRYPAGRESTIYQGQINMVFTNTTPYALLMSSYVAKGYLYVDIWSTPYYRVTTSATPKRNIVQPTIRDVHGPNCLAYPNGQPGFTITNTRNLYLRDVLVDTTSYTWTYLPDDGVKCT